MTKTYFYSKSNILVYFVERKKILIKYTTEVAGVTFSDSILFQNFWIQILVR